MKKSDLIYSYPEELIATEPSRPTRVMWVDLSKELNPLEKNIQQMLNEIPKGDVLVINDTQVLKRRVFAKTENEELEILFLNSLADNHWQVLFPSKKYAVGSQIDLPGGFTMTLVQKGRPQVVQLNQEITEEDFNRIAELPLPPYIQKARHERHNVVQDSTWYQTAWASSPGSQAAPTASLHFTNEDLNYLRNKGVHVVRVTLHVGLGTFLPLTAEDLDQHEMHHEWYSIPADSWNFILNAKKAGYKIWSLGTTSTRVLESVARTGSLTGETNLLLQEGSEFKIVDRLMTNFHQPESTLLALVAGFAGLEKAQLAYAWAIDRKFKLFSYGDLSVWIV